MNTFREWLQWIAGLKITVNFHGSLTVNDSRGRTRRRADHPQNVVSAAARPRRSLQIVLEGK
jgi:hypothetical protein